MNLYITGYFLPFVVYFYDLSVPFSRTSAYRRSFVCPNSDIDEPISVRFWDLLVLDGVTGPSGPGESD